MGKATTEGSKLEGFGSFGKKKKCSPRHLALHSGLWPNESQFTVGTWTKSEASSGETKKQKNPNHFFPYCLIYSHTQVMPHQDNAP